MILSLPHPLPTRPHRSPSRHALSPPPPLSNEVEPSLHIPGLADTYLGTKTSHSQASSRRPVATFNGPGVGCVSPVRRAPLPCQHPGLSSQTVITTYATKDSSSKLAAICHLILYSTPRSFPIPRSALWAGSRHGLLHKMEVGMVVFMTSPQDATGARGLCWLGDREAAWPCKARRY